MKIKNFMKYFKEGVLKYFKISMNFFKYFKVKYRYFIVHPYVVRTSFGVGLVQPKLLNIFSIFNSFGCASGPRVIC